MYSAKLSFIIEGENKKPSMTKQKLKEFMINKLVLQKVYHKNNKMAGHTICFFNINIECS
jgi:antitoxin component YwqK of YwqJK toxin-antitoxin module